MSLFGFWVVRGSPTASWARREARSQFGARDAPRAGRSYSSRTFEIEFVYVCPATLRNITAYAPLAFAGADRIAKVVILVGRDDEVERAQSDSDATLPARALKRVVEAFLKRSGCSENPVVIDEPLDTQDPAIWGERIKVIADEAGPLQVVYSVTGGTKPMTMGITMSGAPLRAVHVWGSHLEAAFFELDESARLLRRFEANRRFDNITLQDRLGLEDLAEPPEHRERCHAMQTRFAEQAGQVEALFQMWRANADLRRDLSERTEHLGRGGKYRTGEVDASCNRLLRKVLRFFEGSGVVEGRCKIFVVEDRWVSQLLRGGWLEVLLFNRAKALIAGRNDVALTWSLKACQLKADGSIGSDFGEIDVALLVRGQLHVLEAKTGWFENETSARQILEQCRRVKSRLLGPPGRYLVINPGAQRDDLNSFAKQFEQEARKAGIEFFLGPDAVDSALAEVGNLLIAAG